jgi:putative ABC transport system permease protein
MRSRFHELASDVVFGLRQIRKNLSLALVCIAVLTIGIGSATAVFAVLYDALLKPLSYRDAGQLVYVHNEFPGSQLAETAASGPDFRDLSTHHELFAETAAYYFNDFTMTGAGAAQHVDAVNASATLFPMLGIPPQLGRTFAPEEDRAGASHVVVLSSALWRSAFGADRTILGKSINLDGEPYQVIGVMPADFNFPYPATQMWVPLALSPSDLGENERGDKWLQMIARLVPGVTPERANTILATLSHSYAVAYPTNYPEKTGWRFSSQPLIEQRTSNIRSWLLLAFGAVGCVLLIACINVSGLLLVRSSVRSREWAVRAALGASPARLIRQIFTETALLAVIGCGAGIFLAIALVRLSNQFGPIHNTTIEPWTYAFSAGVCILATFIASALPAAAFAKLPIEQTLRASATRASTAGGNWRSFLVAGQLAIAIALLFTATSLGRSFVKLMNVPPGFSSESVWTGNVNLPEKRYTSASQVSLDPRFFQDLTRRIAALPGVESASACMTLPFSSSGFTADLYFPGRPETSVRPAAKYNFILPGYFQTMKIQLLEGRVFDEHDSAGSPMVAIVDRTFVQKYFSSEDPVGKLVANNGMRKSPYRIIGVVSSVANRDLAEELRPEIYVPVLQNPRTAMFIVARTKGHIDITSSVRDTLRRMDGTVALFDVETMPARILDSVKLRRFVAWLLNSFALVGLLLAALGLYGTLAHTVQLRRREFAIRMALGATPGNTRALILRHCASIAVAGLVPGALISIAAARATRSFLYGISPLDPWTIAIALVGFFALALIASWIPAMQATRVDALLALREE